MMILPQEEEEEIQVITYLLLCVVICTTCSSTLLVSSFNRGRWIIFYSLADEEYPEWRCTEELLLFPHIGLYQNMPRL